MVGQLRPFVEEVDRFAAGLTDRDRGIVTAFLREVTAALTRHAAGDHEGDGSGPTPTV
jgi:hypothetical protein